MWFRADRDGSMSKILKNTTVSAIFVSDVGVSIAGLGQYTIPEQDYLLWAASSNTVTYVGAAELVVNDGSFDLNISDGIDLIKGLFPSKVAVFAAGSTQAFYNAVTSVPSATTTTVATFTTAAATTLQRVLFSGSNIAFYELKVDGAAIASYRTMFASNFGATLELNLNVASGKTIILNVLHNRPMTGDFEATFIYTTGA
jgi:hypothetical protein